MAAIVTERERSEQQLLSARADIEKHLRENSLQKTHERILAEIEQKLEQVRTPISDGYSQTVVVVFHISSPRRHTIKTDKKNRVKIPDFDCNY